VDAIYPTARDPLQFNEQIREGLEPHKVKEIYLWGSEQANVLVDISDTIEDKIEALKCHKSQVGEATELADRIRQRAAAVAEPHGLKYAEVFRRIVMRMYAVEGRRSKVERGSRGAWHAEAIHFVGDAGRVACRLRLSFGHAD